MKIGWRFPLNDDGAEDGLNHPGIETFLKSPIESLAREIIQNSRDAAKNSGTPVRVDFDLYDVPREIFPGIGGFEKVLDRCADYWSTSGKTQKFFQKAKTIVGSEYIRFLKVSDYNTKGLGGSYEQRGTDWHKLTKSVGASDKGGGQDGSFGIGKHAPYACSALRTVFYGTKDIEGNTAFQGVCKLVSHLDGKGQVTQGTGYFGVESNKGPLHDFAELNDFFGRTRHGTDVFIAGFDYGDDWEVRIIRSVIENFFVALQSGDLSVFVHGRRIDAATLPAWMEEVFAGETKELTLQFYEALTDEKSYFFTEDNFLGLGRVDLHIAVGKEYSKQIAMFRRSGMLVYRKNRFRTPLRFAGVFIARGEELNVLLKSLEPPSHDEWQASRHESPKHAASVLRDLNLWIVEKIREISPLDTSEYIDPEGISKYLPDEADTTETKEQDKDGEDGVETPKPVEFTTRFVQPKGHETVTGSQSGGDTERASEQHKNDEINDEDDGDSYAESGGSDDEPSGPDSTDAGEGSGHQALGGRVNLTGTRVFCTDANSGSYRLACVPEVTSVGHLVFDVVGEVGREVAPVLTASLVETGEQLAVGHGGRIGPIAFEAGKKMLLSVQLKNKLRCALEVSAYAN
ncbi:hypothetical protein R70006_00269 [Paraburkholderia domus]|uniref:hypothetical protein n=1 Tax=Paraburkholderia domus TaxID=2793075 RepID=UPI0019146825|nr:hypothetical protein [Paraburkholderia domus]MBK5047746.1 hypothetical protein [Burkholderia sp. R-70006]CAE6689426.1 hypothetical protein R70006_00269 [Paraburkholderia domus]